MRLIKLIRNSFCQVKFSILNLNLNFQF